MKPLSFLSWVAVAKVIVLLFARLPATDAGPENIGSDLLEKPKPVKLGDTTHQIPVSVLGGPSNENKMKKDVQFKLEIFVEDKKDEEFAQSEAQKLVTLVARIAPHIELSTVVLKATHATKSRFFYGGTYLSIVTHEPIDKDSETLVITSQSIGAQGTAGPRKGCVSKQHLIAKSLKGGDSEDITIHEWLHTLEGKTIHGRKLPTPHANPQFGFPQPSGKDGAGEDKWDDWYAFYLRP